MDLVTTPNDRRRFEVLGVPVDACRDVAAAAIGLQASGGGRVVTLNAEMTMAARSNAALGQAIASAELVIPDGAGVVWALSRQGVKVVKTAGIELAWTLLGYAAAHGWRVALLGASPQVMDILRSRLPQTFPGLNLVLAVDGYQPDPAWSSVWGTQKIHKAPICGLRRLGIPPRRRHRHPFRSVLADHSLKTLGDLVHRLLIADLLPAILAAFTDSLQGHAQSIGRIVYARRCDSFEADILRQQGVVVRNDAGHAAIF